MFKHDEIISIINKEKNSESMAHWAFYQEMVSKNKVKILLKQIVRENLKISPNQEILNWEKNSNFFITDFPNIEDLKYKKIFIDNNGKMVFFFIVKLIFLDYNL